MPNTFFKGDEKFHKAYGPGCKVFVAGLVTVQVPTINTNGN